MGSAPVFLVNRSFKGSALGHKFVKSNGEQGSVRYFGLATLCLHGFLPSAEGSELVELSPELSVQAVDFLFFRFFFFFFGLTHVEQQFPIFQENFTVFSRAFGNTTLQTKDLVWFELSFMTLEQRNVKYESES